MSKLTATPEYKNAVLAVRRYDRHLMRDPNVVGVGVGFKKVDGTATDRVGLTILVATKLPAHMLSVQRMLPTTVDVGGGRMVPTDVVETGMFVQHANTQRLRPAQPGTSLGNVQISAGTYGTMVVDNNSGDRVILSNNHVLAANNQAAIGSTIVQPGSFDGGTSPDDRIATLTRFVRITTGAEAPNRVDAAIATPTSADLISATPLDGVPAPSSGYPAVGLLWGGNQSRSNFSPIGHVLQELDVAMPSVDSTLEPSLGLAVQKTGRTTNRTTGTIQEIHATLRVYIEELHAEAYFRDQFTTDAMSAGGDSGSVAVTNNRQ